MHNFPSNIRARLVYHSPYQNHMIPLQHAKPGEGTGASDWFLCQLLRLKQWYYYHALDNGNSQYKGVKATLTPLCWRYTPSTQQCLSSLVLPRIKWQATSLSQGSLSTPSSSRPALLERHKKDRTHTSSHSRQRTHLLSALAFS